MASGRACAVRSATSRCGAGAKPIRFEPARTINQPPRMIEALSWQRIRTDGELYAFKGDHCRRIAWVVGSLCDAHAAEDEVGETLSIITTFLDTAIVIEGLTTYGTSGQRYEAAKALRREVDDASGRPIGPARVLVDAATGEFVISVADLEASARQRLGSGLERGWARARAAAVGWQLVTIEGWGIPGRAGRGGPHARRKVVRGILPAPTDDEAVTT